MAHRKIVPGAIFVFAHPAVFELVVYNLRAYTHARSKCTLNNSNIVLASLAVKD